MEKKQFIHKETFYVECSVCGHISENWAGSTPCCGVLAFVIDMKPIQRNKKIKKILKNI